MAEERLPSGTPEATAAPCLKLLCKEMFYKDMSDTDGLEEDQEVERLFGTCDTSMYWCDCTQTGRGPDDQPANKETCSRAGRSCYVGLSDLT